MFDWDSEYAPYCSFDEWTLNFQQIKHREKWRLRRERILILLEWMAINQKGKKITAENLAQRYNAKFFDNMGKTAVVAHMRELRYEGFPVNSDAAGYWLNDNLSDIQNTIDHLQDKIYAMGYTIKQLNKHFRRIKRLTNK